MGLILKTTPLLHKLQDGASWLLSITHEASSFLTPSLTLMGFMQFNLIEGLGEEGLQDPACAEGSPSISMGFPCLRLQPLAQRAAHHSILSCLLIAVV